MIEFEIKACLGGGADVFANDKLVRHFEDIEKISEEIWMLKQNERDKEEPQY